MVATQKQSASKPGDQIARALDETCDDAEFFGPDGPCPLLHEPGNPRLVLITGENASGKSFFGKVLRAYPPHDGDRKNEIEWMGLSMSKRTESGAIRAFMFGDEGRDSTGNISLRTIQSGFSTCRSRETIHILQLDEPDIGLSESYAAGLGDYIAQFAADMPDLTEALIVVTHSRHIARRLLPLNPTCIRIGDLRPTAEWLVSDVIPKTIEDVLALKETAHQRTRAIQSILNGRKN